MRGRSTVALFGKAAQDFLYFRRIGLESTARRWCRHCNPLIPRPSANPNSGDRNVKRPVNVERDERLWELVTSGDCEMRHYHILLRYASPERTVQLVKLMLERGVKIKLEVLSTLYRKFVGTAYAERIFMIFEEHCEAANCDADNMRVEELFFFYISVNMQERARVLFDRLCASGTPTRPVYQSMMMNYSKAGKLEQVAEVYSRMIAAGFEPGAYTMGSLITALATSGNLKKAEAAFEKVKDAFVGGAKSYVYANMISTYVTHRRYRQAEALYNSMAEEGLSPSPLTHVQMLKSFVKTTNIEAARRVLRTMQANGMEPRISDYTSLISCYGDAGLIKEAQSLFDTLLDTGPQPDFVTYSVMIKLQGATGNLAAARELFVQMKASGIAPNLIVYTNLIRAHCQSFDMDNAEKILQAMIEDKVKPDAQTFNILIDGYSRAKQLAKAENVVFEMVRHGIKPRADTFTQLIRGYVFVDNYWRAEMLFKAVQAKGFQPEHWDYGKMILSYSKQNSMEKIEELVKEMLGKGIQMSTAVCNELIEAYIRHDKRDDALRIYNKMKAEDTTIDKTTYRLLIDGHVRLNGYRCGVAQSLFKEWKGDTFAEDWGNGTVFVNFVTYSPCVALTALWATLTQVEPQTEFRFLLGDGCLNPKYLYSNKGRQTVVRCLTDLQIPFATGESNKTLIVKASEVRAFRKRYEENIHLNQQPAGYDLREPHRE